MLKIEKNLNLKQEISSQLAFAVILILSFIVAWYSVSAGEEIVKNAKISPTFNINQRITNEMPANDSSQVNKIKH